MIPKLYLTLLFFFIVFNGTAQKQALESITENDLKAHLEFIASDYMQGRLYGTETPGLEITANYLKSQCKKLGLINVVDDYFQNVELYDVEPDTLSSSLKLYDENNNLIYETSKILELVDKKENEILRGEIVFAGYGWQNEKTGYDDLAGIDLRDKFVLIMVGTNEIDYDTCLTGYNFELENAKTSRIFSLGAKGIIRMFNPKIYAVAKSSLLQGTSLLEKNNRQLFPGKMLHVPKYIGDEILRTQNNSIDNLLSDINTTGNANSFLMNNVIAEFSLNKKITPEFSNNVIGVIEGVDPILKKECIVYTAHYDHLGVTNEGEVYNGADDNGSGAVALLEIAEAYSKLKKNPRRSIVFVWTTDEEKGLIGSNFYSQHPAFPLENTLVDINLDMIGRSAETEVDPNNVSEDQLAGPNGLFVVTGQQSSELMKMSLDLSKERGLVLNDKLSQGLINRSDYYHFYKHGIPAFGLTTGEHEDYHQTTDDLDKIDYTKMNRVTQYAFLLGEKVANQRKRIVVDKPSNK